MRAHRHHSRGFTLVEVITALAILAIMSVLVWQTMAISFRTKSRVTEIADRYHEGRQVISRMVREMRMAYLSGFINELELEERPPVVTRFLGNEDELYFATTSHLRLHANARESDQSEVHYFLERGELRGEYRGKTLMRRESARVDDRPDRGGAVWPVVEGVKELKFEYWDSDSEIADDAWRRDWDSQDELSGGELPARVRITLVLEGPGGGKDIRFVAQAKPKVRKPLDLSNQPAVPVGSANP
jgi:general secretion pathway protein J